MDIALGIKQLLPESYECHHVTGGVLCKSKTGIPDEKVWDEFFEKVKLWLGSHF